MFVDNLILYPDLTAGVKVDCEVWNERDMRVANPQAISFVGACYELVLTQVTGQG